MIIPFKNTEILIKNKSINVNRQNEFFIRFFRLENCSWVVVACVLL